MKRIVFLLVLLSCFVPSLFATHLVNIQVIDKEHVLLHFRDGEVRYRDDATGLSAYLGHSFAEGDDTLVVFGLRLNVEVAAQVESWRFESVDDKQWRGESRVKAVWRRSKPMNTDHTLTSELDHWIYLQLPEPMRQNCNYRVTIPEALGSDKPTADIRFDIWSSQSEAIHVNLLGYHPAEPVKAADLYMWLGDGGQRDYSTYEGKRVYLYDVTTRRHQRVGTVRQWKPASAAEHEAGGKNLVGTDVWNIDFRTTKPGRYRLVVEDVGCSMDFDISTDVYREPYRNSLRGYYYMRLGEPIDTPHVVPVPRQPRFIPEVDPKGFTVYKTDFQPWDPAWRALRTDVWDEPHFKPALTSIFWQHRLPGNPVNVDVVGGHSDAFDWDRHLAHVSNIYDMLLPYILTGGRLSEDNLGIRESGNLLPDLIDEARNEVDFFLSIRDGEGYSQGVTNPSSEWTIMFQAGCTTMAAWANAANCAITAEALRIQGNDSLSSYYTREAITAFRYASRQEVSQLDDMQDIGSISMRGRDFRQMAAAFLYNVTGDREWEDIMAAESIITTPTTPLFNKGRQGYQVGGATNAFAAGEIGYFQYYAVAAYLCCPRERHYPELYANMVASLNSHADAYNVRFVDERPSRRAANDSRWQTSQNLHLVVLAHHVADTRARRQQLERAMYVEASWALGRNPGNIVEMTGLGPRHLTDVYTTGRNDGTPESHPGQTPFNGTEVWSPGNGGDATILLNRCYPSWNEHWPRQESYFNQRYMWVNGEFTPRETMRGKMMLLAYLYGIR